jgi:CRP/FNR family transcriptional regulator, cyclic AMP receptor protein
VEKFLEGVPIFAGLDDGALELLLAGARRIEAEQGELIVREGDSSNEMFVIGEGEVRVWKHYGTAEQVELAIMGRKDFFGEMCMLETLPRAATVEALTACTCVGVKSSAFYRLYQARPEQHAILILNLARDLSRRIRALHRRFVV